MAKMAEKSSSDKGISDDAAKWLEDTDSSRLSPPGRDLVPSNFFDVDENVVDALTILDMDRMNNVMEEWKTEAHKNMKKKKVKEVREIKPEEMAMTIGGTVLSERRPAVSGKQDLKERSGSTESNPPQLVSDSLPAGNMPSHPPPRERFVTSPAGYPTLEEVGLPPTQQVVKQTQTAWHVPAVRETINRILVNQPYVLEWYKSLEEKKNLLKEAISTHDGNTIITIIIFLRSTLSKGMFEALLLGHMEAAQHYCSFLRQNAAWEQLKGVYYVLGERYVMIQYQLACSQEAIPSRINALDRCAQLLRDRPNLGKEKSYIEEYSNLLRRQQKMEVIREALPRTAINRFQSVPLIDSTLITSLMYSCRFHLTDKDPTVNPEVFKKDFNVSEKQYFIVLMGSLCARRDWNHIEKILTPTGWQSKLGIGSKVKAPISIERLIRIIGKKQYLADEEFLSKYIRQVDDLETRLEFATKYQCYGVGIEVLKQLKDNERLKSYFDQIPVEKQRKYRPSIVKLFS